MATNDTPDRAATDRDTGTGDTSASHAPEHEPGAATLREDAPDPGPTAPDGPAPDLADINSGDGPGMSPGE